MLTGFSTVVTRVAIVCIAFTFFSGELNAQAPSYMEGGMMLARLKPKGIYEPGWMPGFSIAVSGLEISLYGGQFVRKAFPDSSALNANGGYWNINYMWRSRPRPNLKRFHVTLGAGVGGYGLKGMNGIHLNMRPGVQINLTRQISIAASLHLGYNYNGGMSAIDTTNSFNDNGYVSTSNWFLNPSLTLRINTNPLDVMGGLS